ncbi:hypothetical protein [Psychrobacter sp. WY6]|jgi:hypothetical protein|uniref:hypothetical protein n=1 Tax=Psychrobacter sp. WY6 TaxID=2708350 RepID=UPI002022C6FE|nr:hypothetical protein [Psychrobacter sp. WY6]
MPKSLPPTKPVRPRDKSMLAIVLAVLLHIVVGIVIYFTVFDKERPITVPTVTADNKQSVSAAMVADEKLSAANPKDLIDQIESSKSVNSHKKNSASVSTNNTSANESTTSKQKPEVITNSRDTVAPTVTLSKNDNIITDVESTTNKTPAQAEYKLKQTQEYQQLDKDIDQDNEQLSKLIDEVKKRNQSQIQQHHLPKASETPSDNTPRVQHDYPITPITSLPPKKGSAKDAQAAEGSPTNQ